MTDLVMRSLGCLQFNLCDFHNGVGIVFPSHIVILHCEREWLYLGEYTCVLQDKLNHIFPCLMLNECKTKGFTCI